MKTNFVAWEGHYLKAIGEAVCVGACCAGDDVNETLAEGFIDVFTGDLFGAFDGNYIPAVPTWYQTWKINLRRRTKKDRRKDRIYRFCGTHWGDEFKVLGKNRKLRRRMAPSPDQIKEFESYLPF